MHVFVSMYGSVSKTVSIFNVYFFYFFLLSISICISTFTIYISMFALNLESLSLTSACISICISTCISMCICMFYLPSSLIGIFLPLRSHEMSNTPLRSSENRPRYNDPFFLDRNGNCRNGVERRCSLIEERVREKQRDNQVGIDASECLAQCVSMRAV